MTFFYDLNKRMADLAVKQTLAEDKGSKPDFLDLDKDGNRKESMKQAVADKDDVDESALQAFIGKKKYGDSGMKALQKAGRDGASKDKMAKIRAQHDKMDEAKLQPTAELVKKIRARLSQLHDQMEPEEAYDQVADEFNISTRQLEKMLQDERFFEGDMDEGNEFSGELVKARASGAKEFRVDGKTYPVKEQDKKIAPTKNQDVMRGAQDLKAPQKAGIMKNVAKGIKAFVQGKPEPMDEEVKLPSKGTAFDPEYQTRTKKEKEGTGKFDKKQISTGTVYTRKADDEEAEQTASDQPRKKGRPKGAPKGPERVTAGSYKYKSGRPVKENDHNMQDSSEYDQEGDMAKEQMHTIKLAARELASILSDNENLPEWVQKKITLAMDYIDTARDYMIATKSDRDMDPVLEKAVSKNQAVAARIARAVQKGEIKTEPGTASAEMARMRPRELKKFAKTDARSLPKKVPEADTAGKTKEKKSATGFNFGGGVYESLDRQFQQALNEGMNVSVNMNTGQNGEPTKNITVSADGEDADRLAVLLKMAGLHSQSHTCDTCHETPCVCDSMHEAYGDTKATANQADYPTDGQSAGTNFIYSGGLNGAKSTGQSTTPVLASQLRRQVSMEENVSLERTLFDLYHNYKQQ